MPIQGLVARCPTCHAVADHHEEGRVYRCLACDTRHDLMASLA